MITGLCLCLAALAGGDPGARWIASPAEAQIGQPVLWQLEITSAPGSAVLLPDKDPALDPAWVLLEPRRVERIERANEIVTRLSWKLLALEPGAPAPFVLEVPVEESGGRVTLQPAAAQHSVLAALREGEDAPRPALGFLPPPEPESARPWILWTSVAGLVAAAAALFLVVRWRRARAARTRVLPPGPLERLAQLEALFAAEEARGRELVFGLTQLVRERTDAWLGIPRAALPDEEWVRLVAADTRLPDPARAAARRLLERAEAVKYAQATPSRFLVEELCADARAALPAGERAA